MKAILILVNLETTIYNFRREVVSEMIAQGYRVIICVPKSDRWDELQSLGVELIDVDVKRHGINPFTDMKLLLKYIRVIKNIHPELVMTYTIKPNVYGGVACAITRTKYVATITGMGTAMKQGGLISKITVLLYQFGLRKASTVFFQNTENLEFFKMKKIVKNNVVLTSGSGVNLSLHEFSSYPLEGKSLTLLFIGRIMKDKGIEEFLACAKYIVQKYPNVNFWMLGRDDNLHYANCIKELTEQGVVKYFGQKPSVDEYIYQSHAVIVPSYHEGMCNALLEAQSCGRPVITTRIPGCIETFDEGITGFGCEVRNAQSLIERVIEFIELSYQKKLEMGIAGRKKVEKEFDRNIVVNTYLEEINNIVGR